MLQAIRIPDIASLQRFQALPHYAETQWLISDCSLGSWRSFHIARELFSQTEQSFPVGELAQASHRDMKAGFSYADIIGKGIDAEARGNLPLIIAHQLAAALTRVLTALEIDYRLLLFAPRFGLGWAYEDGQFVRYLQRMLAGTRVELILVFSDPGQANLPFDSEIQWLNSDDSLSGKLRSENAGLQNTLLHQIPALISPAFAEHFSAQGDADSAPNVCCAEGFLLVPPECREDPSQLSPFEHDRLAAQATPFAWLAAFARYHGNNHYLQCTETARIAWQHFSEGAGQLALKIMDRLTPCGANATERAVLQCQSQGMRIALHKFAEAGQCAEPPVSVPEVLRSFLLTTRGWGLVFTGQGPDAVRLFAQAGENISQSNLVEYLYFLNITALAAARTGNTDTALALEQEIAEKRQRLPSVDHMLGYVNALNTARLHRWRGDYGQAARFYNQAFSTTTGLRSPTDLFFVNASFARLAEDRQCPDQALVYWLRAALHWLASPCPEAIGFRAVKVVVCEPEALTPEQLTARLASALEECIVRNITYSSQPAFKIALQRCQDEPELQAPVFCAPDDEHVQPVMAVGFPGVSAFLLKGYQPALSQQQLAPTLRRLLWEILRQQVPCIALAEATALLIDHNFGQEMAENRLSLQANCLRLGVRHYQYQQENVVLSPQELAAPGQRLVLRKGVAIDSIEHSDGRYRVHFKRYRAPLMLSALQYQLLRQLDQPVRFTDVDVFASLPEQTPSLYHLARQMERDRLLHMELG